MLELDHMMDPVMDPDAAVDMIPKKIWIRTNPIGALMAINLIPDPAPEKIGIITSLK